MRLLACVLAFVTLALAVDSASAHETLHEILRGNAIAVKAYFADGEVLAYTPYELYSPADRKIPYQKGRTDRGGWVAFVPDTGGKWRLKVISDTGHGLDVEVDADAVDTKHPAAAGSTGVSNVAFVLRPLLGILAIGAVFAALFIAYRRRETTL